MTRSPTFLGINLGVAEVRVILLDEARQILADAAVPLACSCPQSQWIEQSPEEWWHATLEAMCRIRAEAPEAFARLRSIGVSGQTQGVVLLDKHHRVLRPAILWSDGRSRAECVELEALVTDTQRLTGSTARPGFTAPKLLWLQKYEPSVFKSIEKILMPKDFIVFRLSGELTTDMSDASATLCFNVAKRDWSERMISALGLSPRQFPRLAEGSAAVGSLRPAMAEVLGLSHPVLIAAGGGRPASIAVGLGALQEGMAYLRLGHGSLVFVTTESARLCPSVRSAGHCLPNLWSQLGVAPTGMASLDWWSKIQNSGGREALMLRAEAASKETAPIFLPYLNGTSTPYNDPRASGVFFGLTEETSPAEMAYSVLEGVAFSAADSLLAIQDSGTIIQRASLIGNAPRNGFWDDLLVTACNLPLSLHAPELDAESLGAAYLACLATGDFQASELCLTPPVSKIIFPRDEWREELALRFARFRRIYQSLQAEFAIQEPVS